MKAYYFIILLFVAFTQSIYGNTINTESESIYLRKYLDVLEDGFPPMTIKLYTGDEPSNGIFACNTNYQFIVQPVNTVVGFESKRFDFAWFFPGGVTSSVKLEGHGIQLATFLANVPQPGRYTLTVQLWDGAGHSTVVERVIVFE